MFQESNFIRNSWVVVGITLLTVLSSWYLSAFRPLTVLIPARFVVLTFLLVLMEEEPSCWLIVLVLGLLVGLAL